MFIQLPSKHSNRSFQFEMLELTLITITLHLDDRVLREVSSEATTAGIWKRLEELYLKKSLQDKIYLKGKLFGFKMNESKSIGVSLDEFNKLMIDLANIDVKQK